MSDRFSPVYKVFIPFCFVTCMIFISACGASSVTLPPANIPCPTPMPGRNPYTSNSYFSSSAVMIYNEFKSGVDYNDTRKRAFSLLGKHTEHWSQYQDIAIDANKMVRITVTYLDPILIQYIVLNNTLFPDVNDTNGDVDAFVAKIKKKMDELSGRNEILFLVIITAPFYEKQAYNDQVLTLQIPIKIMKLVNGSDLSIGPAHDDHVLDENIKITHGPVSGVAGYPISVMIGENCTWVIDQYTNTLNLNLEKVTLGGQEFHSLYWSIPYRPLLVMETNNSFVPYDPSIDLVRIHPYKEPPRPYWGPGTVDPTDWKTYWEEMGGYIWNSVYQAMQY